MKHIFTKYKLALIKEESSLYEAENKLSSPKDIYSILVDILNIDEEPEEVLIILTLNVKNFVTGMFEVSRGCIDSSIVHPRELFKRAILNNASKIVVAHNHPSGDPTPSKQDIQITRRLVECGKILGIEILDHVVIGSDTMVSLKDKGIL